LAEIQPDPDLMDDADLDAQLDEEERQRDAELRRLGFTDSEISRVRGGREGVAPKPTVASVDAELAEIDEQRRTDKVAYFKNDALQQREVALIALRQKLKSGEGPAPAQDRKAETDSSLADSLSESVLEVLSQEPDGLEGALGAIEMRTTVLGEMLDADEEQKLRQSINDLPADEQQQIAIALATDSGRWPAASATHVEEFAETPWGKELVADWGASAPTRLGAARREYDFIFGSAKEASKMRLQMMYNGWNTAQRKAAIQVLATRAARRSLIRSSDRRR
jgi:hypothetical protein